MIIKVSDIREEGVTVDDAAAIGPFADPAWRLDAVRLRVQCDDRDLLMSGEIRATVPRVCGRCLEPFPVAVHADVDVRVIPRPATADNIELAPDDLDVDFYQNDELDVSALVEAETGLALPMKPLCRDDCRGLCPVCGGNRNVVACACGDRAPDPRLTVLKDLVARPSH
jgi:uncharacterized protein